MKVQALVKRGIDNVVPEMLELEDPRADEVLVRIVSAGICRTDLEVLDGHLTNVPDSVVLGHEGAGVVEEIGSEVTTVSVGDVVVLAEGACGTCDRCRSGRYPYCVNHDRINFSGQRLDGSTALTDESGDIVHSHFFAQSSWSSHVLAHQSNTIKVSPKADPMMLGSFGCGIQTGAGAVLNVLDVQAGSTVAVFGVGMVGQAAIMAARVAGASTIIAIGQSSESLQLAREVGATHIIKSEPSMDLVATVHRIVGDEGVDYSVEATGAPSIMAAAVNVLKETGHAAITGVAAGQSIEIDAWTLIKGRTIHGTVLGDSVPSIFIPRLVELYLQGRFPADKLMTHYTFGEMKEALSDADKGKVVKAILHP
ncbi:NAD(P)-dependent alcohol dehydrogenase [Rhodococcus tibetensis]|uniref:NAD(P)-dependent alcohol dehydrogenase n=1 Tax=Rhodococcus tibetensis TaxID=2965064 RepID=A0ABT1QJ85_9NOCA|nr:NAD(P)-dependent alcohol dehydrogenase [Rhodococcus sp. FXJ9.536]MCQ4122330.1 NAD(P)-dependent alcohol dehydrogenase [Rhodococcus sp. FXJ9.536]